MIILTTIDFVLIALNQAKCDINELRLRDFILLSDIVESDKVSISKRSPSYKGNFQLINCSRRKRKLSVLDCFPSVR